MSEKNNLPWLIVGNDSTWIKSGDSYYQTSGNVDKKFTKFLVIFCVVTFLFVVFIVGGRLLNWF